MFDTMTFTKIAGSLCGALLILLLGKWAAEELFHVGGHGDHAQAYVIDTGVDETPTDEPVLAFADVYAAADPGKGERVFRQCSACHKLVTGDNGVGPYLHHVVGREVGTAEGYTAYSGALSAAADVWTPENLNGFLENPRSYADGTSMAYNGLRDIEDRANLIAYLATYTE